MKQSAKNVYQRLFRSVSEHRRTKAAAVDAPELPRAPGIGVPHIPPGRTPMPLLGSGAGRLHPQIQSGVLAWRRSGKSDIEILLVRKMRSQNWGIPKGKLKRGLSSAENAAKEAFEEAGIRGHVSQRVVATYRAVKRQLDQKIVIAVSVHLLEVTETATQWPEKHKRDVRWCSPQQAAKLLNEPVLIELCSDLQHSAT